MFNSGVISRFARDQRGVTALMFALTSLVVIGSVGLSIDGARVYAAQQRLQVAVDAASLAAARVAAKGGNTDAIESSFNRYLNAASNDPDLQIVSKVVDASSDRRVTATVIGKVDTTIMPILGFNSMELNISSAVSYGVNKVEIAMALDNTGSMDGPKLDALQASAQRLVDTLLDQSPAPGAVRFALVPFAQYVNVGLDKRGAPWLDVPADYSETTDYCRDVSPIISQTNCRDETYTYYNDGVPYTGTARVCDNTYGPPVYTCTPSTANYTWRGCVGSRHHPLNVQDGTYATPIQGLLNTNCPSQIQPLTDDRSTLRTAISGMLATGETYIPGGVMWGLRALSKAQPFAESDGDDTTATGETIKKFLIVMTDGANTKSPVYPNHNGTDAALANQLTSESCAAAKAARVRVFTIAFDVTDTALKNLLRACATSSAGFFDASDPAQLDASMQAIGNQISALRLTN